MNSPDVLQYFDQLHPLPTRFKTALERQLVVETYRKGEVIYSPGRAATRIWYVSSGYLYRYHFERDIRITDLYAKNSLIVCCYTAEDHNDYIKVLADCTLSTIHPKKLSTLITEGFDTTTHERIILMKELARKERAAQLARLTPEERFQALMEDFPKILSVAPQQVITSYLNISRGTLSKLRSKL